MTLRPQTQRLAPSRNLPTTSSARALTMTTEAANGCSVISARPSGSASPRGVPPETKLLLLRAHWCSSAESLGVDIEHVAQASLRYEHGFQDPLIAQIAFAIVSEMRTSTAGGRLLAENTGGQSGSEAGAASHGSR